MLIENFVALFLESAPWLLLGLFLAALLKVFVPMAWMNRQLGGHGFKTTIKAALLGAPLPLCSCGVIPAAIGLRRAGASKAATTSFLVSTPETGIDSVSVSYVLLGPFMACVRPISAIISAIIAGLLVGRDEVDASAAFHSSNTNQHPEQKGCCMSTKKNTDPQNTRALLKPQEPTQAIKHCCSSGTNNQKITHKEDKKNISTSNDIASNLKEKSVLYRIGWGIRYASTDLVKDTTLWLLIGLFFAALITTYVPGDFLAKWGDGIFAMLVMVIVSVPMYICATASTPIAAGLLLAGVSPGAVLVFMLAGPATNIATLGVVRKELGQRALWSYLGGVLGGAFLSGITVNYLVETFHFKVMPQIGPEHTLLPDWLVVTSGILLSALMLNALITNLAQKWFHSAHQKNTQQ